MYQYVEARDRLSRPKKDSMRFPTVFRQPLIRGHVPRLRPPVGRDQRGRRRSAAIPPNELSLENVTECAHLEQHIASCNTIAALLWKPSNPPTALGSMLIRNSEKCVFPSRAGYLLS